jgi:PAS domain S-box-containing protein
MSASDEKARVAALRRYAVLDSLPEESFDRITRLAARWFDAPIALFTLVDEDRQRVKAGVGFDKKETDLDLSFCIYTIRNDGVMVVEDATQDERFADHPLVTGAPGIRFYAGAPLVTPDGYRIGALCVMDTTPRSLDDPTSRETLQDLAQMAMDQMKMRVANPRHADILESITDAFFALNDNWEFTYLNQQAEELLQRTRDELLGRNVWDEFPEAVELDFYEQYHRAVREGERVQFEAYFPPLETWFRVNAYPFSGGLSVYFNDVTAGKQAQEALRAREEYLAVTLQSIGDAVIATDTDGRVTEMNPVAETLTGWPLDEAAARPLSDIFRIENVKTGVPVESPVEKVLHEGQIVGLANHTMLTARDGTRYQIADSAAPIRTDDGDLLGVVLVFRDVTDKYHQEEALREERQRLELALTGGGLGLWDFNYNTRKNLVNDRWAEMLGLAPNEVEPTYEFFEARVHPDDRSLLTRAMVEHIHNGAPIMEAEIRMRHADGSWRWILDRGKVVEWNEDGTPRRAVGTHLDITERKKREEQLRRQHDLLEQTQRLAGAWEYDLENGNIEWSEEVYHIHELSLDTPIHIEDGIRFYAPEAQPVIRGAVERAIEEDASWDLELPLITAQGNRRWVRTVGAPVQDASGEVVKLTGAFQDITERKAAEQDLLESEERYRTLVERSHDAIYIYRGTRLLFVNERACELTGYTEDELLSMNVFDLVYPDDRERVRGYAQQRMRGAAPSRYEARLQRKDGSVRYADFSVQAITYQGEHAAIGSIRDVTERRAVEEALRESEQRFRALAEETTDVVTRHAPDGTYLYVSPSATDVLGYAPNDLVGTAFQPLIHPDDLERVKANIAAARREGKKVQFEYRIRHTDGHYLWVETAGQHVSGDGGVATLIASTRSVAERKAVEQALVRREQRVEALYEAMRDLTEARTHEQVAEHILTLIDDTLGYPISVVRYQTDDDLLVPVAISGQSQALMPTRPDYDLTGDSLAARAFRRGETLRYDDVRALDAPGDLGVVRAAAYVPIGLYGTISIGSMDVGAIDEFDLKLIEILARNADGVIERINREDALRAARDEAEEMNRLKSAFLANMSHEIRTPLTSIIGFSEVLGEQDLGKASTFAHLIQRGGQRLLETLNSVLDLSQLEAGSMRLAPKDIDVDYETQSAVSFFKPRAEEQGIDLRVHLPDEPVEAHLDAAAVQRILNNLLSNAVKFTPAGGRIDVRLKTPTDHLVLEVEDTGVGMDADFLPHVFDAFRQESTGNARAFEGSGLGLAITHQLVQLMGGTINVATEKGVGTRFTVVLPYRIVQ